MIPLFLVFLALQVTPTTDSLIEGGATNTTGLWLGVALGVVGGIGLAVAVFVLHRPRPDVPQIHQLRLVLREQIAVIEQQYAAGEIDEAAYQQQRDMFQAQLDELGDEP